MSWRRRIGLGFALVAILIIGGCDRAAAPVVESSVTSQSPTDSAAPSVLATASVPDSRTSDVCTGGDSVSRDELKFAKPVIYLYPQRTSPVRVDLRVNGRVTRCDPPLDSLGGWSVLAQSSGRLVTAGSGVSYPYLFWEAEVPASFDMASGFVVRGSETRRFLDDKLALLGLNDSESRQFEEYWVPLMQANAYNLIHFEGPAYERTARLDVTPRPDTVIRVFMAYAPLTRPVVVAAQRLPSAPNRHGFVLVEWGGSELPAR